MLIYFHATRRGSWHTNHGYLTIILQRLFLINMGNFKIISYFFNSPWLVANETQLPYNYLTAIVFNKKWETLKRLSIL